MQQRGPQPGVEELRAIVRGHVQGVFFRATTQEHARALGLVGTVRNCEDGSVEVNAQGSRETLEALIKKLKDEPGMGRIEDIAVTYCDPTEHHDDFHIIFW